MFNVNNTYIRISVHLDKRSFKSRWYSNRNLQCCFKGTFISLYMLMKNSILYMNEQLLGYWIEDLIWCPSQCYYYFLDPISSQGYCIYLRWRHSDPWTAELIKCTSDWEFIYDEPWEYIELKRDYSSNEYRSLEKKVLKVVKKRFSAVTFKNRVYEKEE